MTLHLVAACVALFVGGPILISLALSRADRCCSCRRRCDLAPGVLIIRQSDRFICSTCFTSTEPMPET